MMDPQQQSSQATGDSAGQGEKEPALVLSPSERIGYTTATKLSGGSRHGSTQRALASVVLGFEMVIIFLTGLTLFGLNVFQPREAGLIIGGVVCLMCIIALALMRNHVGIILGWIVQLLLVIGGFWLPAIWAVALMFGGLWVYCMVRGAAIDRAREAYQATLSGA
ncbi:DUF4233 domain-containing protein [Canibacter oris]|uniref:DUF4233 domain-containing protein n=1 Tax=Canibacter oris TaxID=1365628 RepID=A0A840DNT5_9MICO|nr:DUF4233 domain-containing protein [Canibacter oris]MBB4070856.1 hypothetical protein [Canibacter oris]